MDSLILAGILVEVVIVIAGIIVIKQLQKNQTRQPALSKKIIRKLKF